MTLLIIGIQNSFFGICQVFIRSVCDGCSVLVDNYRYMGIELDSWRSHLKSALINRLLASQI